MNLSDYLLLEINVKQNILRPQL